MTVVRVISNGHGEDIIAARLISAIGVDTFQFNVIPLVGNGRAYRDLGLMPLMTQPQMPSGGFLLRLKDVISDVRSGLFIQFQKQRRMLRHSHADYQIVIGDVFALFMASYQMDIPTVFFPTAKSERSIPHYGVEFYYIRKTAQLVFPRDIETHQMFYKKNISTRFLGNPMFDGMNSNIKKSNRLTILLLPGSRGEAVHNLAMMLSILERIKVKHSIEFMVALSSSFQLEQLKQVVDHLPWIVKKQDDQWLFQHTRYPVSVRVSYSFFDALHVSSVVIGLAGTANEQAMHAKRQLISFIGTGPQSTKKRFLQQHQLLSDVNPIFIDSNDPNFISKKLSDILNQRTFNWTPLSDHYQEVSKDIAICLASDFFQSKSP